ncbi:LysR substrate-binding domain-containing protein [Mesorhizobium sp. IMUNJ 23033]|uniref:LysR substrate-binding domain-containing protein n=1 Tax=Mesorhizobium sp. IMUNJ 23033 TaxID=3378039 RepID=UPI00384AD8D4
METFASNWLAVWLGTFQLMHPDLAVKVNTSSRLVDFTREDMDIGIRTGTGKWPGLTAHYLFKADYTQCSARNWPRAWAASIAPRIFTRWRYAVPTIPGGKTGSRQPAYPSSPIASSRARRSVRRLTMQWRH